MVREKAQEFIQQIMEEEVTELLGREKSERSSTVDSAEGYRNGYGKPRRLAMSSGTITLRRPRVRGVEERFESRVLPLFARRTKELGALLPELYLHGLAEGDFELAMRGLLGEGAPLSKSSIQRLRAGWTAEFEEPHGGWPRAVLEIHFPGAPAGRCHRTTLHGFRTSIRSWMAETGVDRETAEAVLAHVVRGTEGAYMRSDLLARRREVMQAWSDYVA